MRDPANLLKRIPDLGSLAAKEIGLADALATGDPLKVYRRLWWSRLLGRQRGAVVDALLGDRRLFLRAGTPAPIMFTLNGVGARVYGRADRQPDGSYIGTHFFTVLYLPILPFSEYLMVGAGKKSYYFYGRVPVAPKTWLWQCAVALALLAGGLFVGERGYHGSRYNDVVVVNALRVPLTVMIGDVPASVPAVDWVSVEVPVGTLPVRVELEDGSVLEEGALVVESHTDVVAWNVGGAAPIYFERVPYSVGEVHGEQPEPTVFCGRQVVDIDGVNFVFEEADATMSIPEGKSILWASRVGVAMDQPDVCVGWLLSENRVSQAAALARLQADLPGASVSEGLRAATLMGLDEGWLAAASWGAARAQSTGDLAYARYAQDVRVHQLGEIDAVRSEARKAWHADASSADAAYLYYRVAPPELTLTELAPVVAAHPDHPRLAYLLAWTLVQSQDWSAGLARLDAFQADFPSGSTDLDTQVATTRAWALSGLGLRGDALDVLLAMPMDADGRVAALILARQLDAEPPALDGLSETTLLRVQARAGLPIDPTDDAVALVQAASWKGPGALLEQLDQTGAVGGLDEVSWALAYGEALRTQRTEIVKGLEQTRNLSAADLAAAQAWLLRGSTGPLLNELALSTRAALMLERARQPGLAPDDARLLLVRARQLDVLPGVVSAAASLWGLPPASPLDPGAPASL